MTAPSLLLPLLKQDTGVPITSLISNNSTFQALIDTGADYSTIDRKLAEKLRVNILPCENVHLLCANDETIKVSGKTDLNIQLGDKKITHSFYILSKLALPCIIGRDIIGSMGLIPNIQEN